VAISAHICPPLTTIAQPKYALGKRAMEMALALIQGAGEVHDVVLPPELVERESCRRIGTQLA